MIGTSTTMGWRQRRILGWRADVLAACLVGIAVAVWGLWLTREILILKERRIVSVSLQTLVEDYVAGAAREGLSEAEAQRRTKAYLAAVEAAIASLNDGRTTVVVSEAVVGSTVPDVTPAVKAAIARGMGSGDKADAR